LGLSPPQTIHFARSRDRKPDHFQTKLIRLTYGEIGQTIIRGIMGRLLAAYLKDGPGYRASRLMDRGGLPAKPGEFVLRELDRNHSQAAG
jgi:hypothetical protein